MKKVILLSFIIIFGLITKVIAYEPSISDNLIINKLVNKINKAYSDKSITEKTELKNTLYKTRNQNKSNQQLVYILDESLKKLHLYDYKNEYQDHYNDFDIDFNYIEDTWIGRHNYERNQLGLNLMKMDSRLNNSAYEWSKYQSSVDTMTHERTPGDGYYNYPIIEKWFQDRLIKCKVAGGVTSSESIAQYGFSCNDGNCNDELLESLQEIFIIYMNEKGLSYPSNAHYKSIIHSDLKNIGMGLYITNTDEKNYFKYYVTTHYCTEFSN